MTEPVGLVVEAEMNCLPVIEESESLGGDVEQIRQDLQFMMDNLEGPDEAI